MLTVDVSVDGVKPSSSKPGRARTISSASSTASSNLDKPPSTNPSHVKWVPLSPQSSRTLLRHRKEHAGSQSEADASDLENDNDSQLVQPSKTRRRRRKSDPSSDRPVVSRRKAATSDHSSPDGEEVTEVLPDRFDPAGRPLDARGARTPKWTTRQGDFEYRNPKPAGWNMRGEWGVAGTDPDAVESIVRDFQGVLSGGQGVGGLLGLAGRLLGGGLLGQNEEGHQHDEGGGSAGGASEISRDSRGKGIRRINDHGYDDNDGDEDDEGNGRRRRRRRRREN